MPKCPFCKHDKYVVKSTRIHGAYVCQKCGCRFTPQMVRNKKSDGPSEVDVNG